MNNDILNTTLLAVAFLVLFGIAEGLYHVLKVKVELTRKLVHTGTGLLTFLFPIMLGNHWLVLLLCSSFMGILIVSLRFHLLPSINAIDRESVGSIAYPVAVYGCYLAFDYFNHNYLYFYLPILILAFCDPIAALMGKRWPVGKYKVGKDKKTMMGSGMFFLSATLLTLLLFSILNNGMDFLSMIGMSMLVAVVSATTEAVSRKGYDNITIPLSVILVLIVMH